jgi:hypothetical protein
MKGFRSVVMASLLVAATGSAWALGDNDSVAGTVKRVDQKNHELTLDNGKSYSVASNVKIDNLQPGDRVNVTTDAKGTSVTRIEQTGTQSMTPSNAMRSPRSTDTDSGMTDQAPE